MLGDDEPLKLRAGVTVDLHANLNFHDHRTLPPLHPALLIFVLDRESELTVPMLVLFPDPVMENEGFWRGGAVACAVKFVLLAGGAWLPKIKQRRSRTQGPAKVLLVPGAAS